MIGRFREVHVDTFSVKQANKKLLPNDIGQQIIIRGIVTTEEKYSRVCMGPNWLSPHNHICFSKNGRDFSLLRLRTQHLHYYIISATLLKIGRRNKKYKNYARQSLLSKSSSIGSKQFQRSGLYFSAWCSERLLCFIITLQPICSSKSNLHKRLYLQYD